MKLTNTKISSLWAGLIMIFCSCYAYAEESHITQAIKHAEAATKAQSGKAIAEHAETGSILA